MIKGQDTKKCSDKLERDMKIGENKKEEITERERKTEIQNEERAE